MYQIEESLLKLAYTRGISNQGRWTLANWMMQYPYKEIGSEDIVKIGRITTHRELFRTSWKEIHSNQGKIQLKQSFITCFGPNYPPQLFHLTYPPIVLFCSGDPSLLSCNTLSVAGGRYTSVLAKRTVYYLLEPAIEAGYVIVSGCTKGIGTYSHQTTISHGGWTIMVIGIRMEQVYPTENRDLQEVIANDHLLLSEYPSQSGPKEHRSPMRDRIIAALSRGTCVFEAKKKSGSLITAQQALNLGRTVFSVPGNILTKHSAGHHHLIQDSAVCTIPGEDILTEFKE